MPVHVQEQNYGNRRGVVQATGSRESIRFSVQIQDADSCSSGKCYCEAVNDVVDNFSGKKVTCTDEDILTNEKRQYLESILKDAVEWLQKSLKVDRVVGPLVISTNVCQSTSGVRVPAAHMNPGITAADFVLYVAAVPTEGITQAWAASCQDDQHHRPVAALLNFAPAKLRMGTRTERQNSVNVAIHEIIHTLGFNNVRYNQEGWFPLAPTPGQATRSENGVTLMVTPQVLEKARAHFGCNTMTGVPLENQGGPGTALSHWEKRLFGNEAMTGAQSTEVSVLSEITLAYLEDTGMYSVDYSQAQPLVFGKGRGCDFVQKSCKELGGPEFCFPTPDKKKDYHCSYSLKAYGTCGLVNREVPKEFQYFDDATLGGLIEIMDYCPVYSAATQCTDIPATDCIGYGQSDCASNNACFWNDIASECISWAAILGESYGSSSRCFESDVTASKWGAADGDARCMYVRCSPDGSSYNVKVGGHLLYCDADTQFAMPVDPSAFQNDWKGSVPCHHPSKVCDGSTDVSSEVAKPAPPSAATPEPRRTEKPTPPPSKTDPPTTPPPTTIQEGEEDKKQEKKGGLSTAGVVVLVLLVLVTLFALGTMGYVLTLTLRKRQPSLQDELLEKGQRRYVPPHMAALPQMQVE